MPETAKNRLTETAIRLFTERGLTQVGINEIIREADVARMSLYNNFRSKDDLAHAAYTMLSQRRLDAIDAAIKQAADPQSAILAIFDLAGELACAPSFRGCALIALAAHTQLDQRDLTALIRHHKAAVRDRFIQLAKVHGQTDPVLTGRQLLALWDGALTGASIEGDIAPIAAARSAAAQLLR
ncbi:TetR/AcrR family transcriptional regulator [Boseongicola sp. H5]|uniref:TetR/AcrR family transcriptional regulator n=1 Tax=Boseongicola sp. H5 TaxID=2763261 RepID=UPI001D0A11EF|nr:TetR/AcrR family transcriptional regulator [Boseongicola sp. H5]